MILDKLQYLSPPYTKTHFSASDFGKSELELWLKMNNVPETNPSNWRSYTRMNAGNGVEEVLLKTLQDSGVVDEYYIQEFDGRVEFDREGLEIHGYMDAVTKENDLGVEPGVPIEIKSINNKNTFDIRDYTNGKPRENYVGQLAIYMDFLKSDVGYLFVCSVDGLHSFFLKCEKVGDGLYKCGSVVVNINNEYKRWAKILKQKPDIFEYRYKYPLEKIDWKKLSKSAISKARNNQAVLGDWQITYSPYKDFIIELQGETLGYTDKELIFIRDKTEGYTTW